MDPVTICRMALGWIGANLINSLNADNPQSVEEELCADNFPQAVRSTLEAKAWLFATGSKPIDLGVSEETGDLRWPVRFAVPAEVISVHYCDDGSGDFTVEWERRNGYVVAADTTRLFAIATVYEPDPNRWTPTFVRAVAARLAADLAPVLAPERAGLDTKMEARYTDALSKAGVFDLRQSSGRKIGAATPLMRRR